MKSVLVKFLYRVAALLARLSPGLARRINALAIGRLVKVTRTRPHPWSTYSDHVSWRGLTDRSYSARHLPATDIPDLPDLHGVGDLFRVPEGREQRLCPKSTCLFPAFAQYLTDGFIRTMVSNKFGTGETIEDRRRNTSNHEIDLCPLYGRTVEQVRALRTLSEHPDERGRLKSEVIDGEEWPLRLFQPGGEAFNPEFTDAEGKPLLDTPLGIDHTTAQRRETLFAVGGDRANAAPQVSMINVLFLREHNRLASAIAAGNPHWNDDRVFDAARACTVVMFIKIVVEEYINHINSTPLMLIADAVSAWRAGWNRPNWITAEFSLLYRWHSLVPDRMVWGGEALPGNALRLNNARLLARGLAQAFADISGNRATELGLHNTVGWLIEVEEKAVDQARLNRIAPFVAYQGAFGHRPARDWADINPDPAIQDELRALYGEVGRVEFYPGLFAQPRTPDGPLPPLLQTMVAVDAFSQALTNPLLSEHVWGDPEVQRDTFTPEGIEAIADTRTLRDILDRNSAGVGERFVGMTREGWQRGRE
ncbi:peroxidase family protein [Erythrobacter sp. JK5]|uniref:peroxidase family protein n=1 Tax=Erythrobacter sp. JK5 TaxID=2829500 RepID=UPI001BA4CA57|nr:peroxidase family protein [Erythrobacter sp. JK5]QUL36617.1 heme peroxidase [Erythrobacter sp. JK5]